MRAIVLNRIGGPEELQPVDVADPQPGRGEVVVRVRAEGVCGRDLIDRRGGFRGLPLPVILGHEFAGEIASRGEGVVHVAVGDRVANLLRIACGVCRACARGDSPLCEAPWQSFGQTCDGGYAELVRAPAAALVRIPAEVSFVDAASAACTFGVALRALCTVGELALGDDLLITGASGGVGMAALQIARAMGVNVIAATSSPSKVDALRKAGADHVVVDSEGRLHDEVRQVLPAGVDAVLELTGAPTFGSALRSLRPGGRVLLVGNIPTEPLKLNPGATILYGHQVRGSAGCTRSDLERVFALLARGRVHAVIDRVLPLGEAADAHRLLAERRAVGRVVLIP
jgi:acryloyl-coenzyme A reductase